MKRTRLADLGAALQQLRLPRDGVAIVHSSMLRFGQIEDGLPGVLWMLRQVLGEGCTLLMPAFTLSYGRTRQWDWQASKAETGALCEHFRRLPGTLRTLHPFHSLAVAGPLAERFAACRNLSSFGPGSPWELLVGLDAVNLALGTDFEGGATFLHHAEQTAQVPYRHHKDFPGAVRGPDGQLQAATYGMYVREIGPGHQAVNRWQPVWDDLVAAGLVRQAAVQGTPLFAMDIAPVHAWLHQRLCAQPMYCAERIETETATGG
ncbi:AAC(3) family N-acetyltransferase [Pseudaquabacterium pictum]|uniref:Aminoglycoside N(3)-acetyltransferase n=1 Tax=Pseudaquabacterium pictum TaxID=2315236 RepID=A0A480B0R8_9BURK|nr:AAC(3) family N-acetyltransferase [Rubrivivax pictus]GCL65937.1 hypothetical protein AQPW35_50180 [Rubrivivax pictus]